MKAQLVEGVFNPSAPPIWLGMKHLSKHNIERAGGQTPPKASALPMLCSLKCFIPYTFTWFNFLLTVIKYSSKDIHNWMSEKTSQPMKSILISVDYFELQIRDEETILGAKSKHSFWRCSSVTKIWCDIDGCWNKLIYYQIVKGWMIYTPHKNWSLY